MMEKLIGITILTVIVILGIILVRSRNATVAYAPAAGTNIAVLGDSLTVGVGDNLGSGWVPQVEAAIERSITRFAVSGDTTADGLARLDVLRSTKPDVVIVFLGGNDALRRAPVSQTFINLRTIITQLHEDGVLVILVGVRGSVFGDRYQDEFIQLAQDTRAALVPNVMKDIWGNPDRMSPDNIHPNHDGYTLIAERIIDTITPLLQR